MYVYISTEKARALRDLMTLGEFTTPVGAQDGKFIAQLAGLIPELAVSNNDGWLEARIEGFKGDVSLREAKDAFDSALKDELRQLYRELFPVIARSSKPKRELISKLILDAFRSAYEEARERLAVQE